MKFRIDLRIFLFMILFYFTKQIEIYLMVLVFAFIHELGHLLAGIALGMKPEKIEVIPTGLRIQFKLKPKDYNIKIRKGNLLELKKIIVAIAGPLTNLIIILIVENLHINIFTQIMVILSNLVIIIYNLLPIYSMDGGRILKGFLHTMVGKKKGLVYTHRVSCVIIILVTIIAVIGIVYFKNIAIFLAIVYLWCIYIVENKQYKIKNNIYEIIENY